MAAIRCHFAAGRKQQRPWPRRPSAEPGSVLVVVITIVVALCCGRELHCRRKGKQQTMNQVVLSRAFDARCLEYLKLSYRTPVNLLCIPRSFRSALILGASRPVAKSPRQPPKSQPVASCCLRRRPPALGEVLQAAIPRPLLPRASSSLTKVIDN
jgi:hypothetical protein